MGGTARLRHLDLRRLGRDCDRWSDPRAAAGASAGVVAGRRVRGVVFGDAGDVEPQFHFGTIRSSIGTGVRLILPFLAQAFLSHEPMVAGAWMGLAIKTDGAAIAGGGITEALILAQAASDGVKYQPGWILGTTTTVKVFIDIFIGIWAFVLGYIWTNHINKTTTDKTRIGEIWERFPKFVLGFVVTFAIGLVLVLATPADVAKRVPTAMGEANTLRVIFFILTFFSIGVLSNFKKLWQEGIGKLAAVYVVSLFGFVIWVGLAISWLFFSGIKPPLAT